MKKQKTLHPDEAASIDAALQISSNDFNDRPWIGIAVMIALFTVPVMCAVFYFRNTPDNIGPVIAAIIIVTIFVLTLFPSFHKKMMIRSSWLQSRQFKKFHRKAVH